MESKLKRGNVYRVNLDPAQGSEIKKVRPGVMVGASPLNQARKTVLIVPLSRGGEARPPITVKVRCQGQEVRAVCDQIRAVDKTRLSGWIEEMASEDLENISKALKQVLALP
ncbi:MAG: type II toxin-antitoxin system PemK/MazF family toxin [Deltaproteobacteria bacterium]|nr:type II toxin-antitoxin system PemK/MazF family toxin [Deltaproteobacteria bacterium]